MEIPPEFIEAHQIAYPERGEPIQETPFTIEFTPELTNLELFLEDVFDGDAPFYMPGMCRPVTLDGGRYTVGAVACPLPDESAADVAYDVHYPSDKDIWFDVTTAEMDVYVRETVPPARVQAFCESLDEKYGVELRRVTGLPAVPTREQSRRP